MLIKMSKPKAKSDKEIEGSVFVNDRGRSAEVRRHVDGEQTIEGRDARRGHASAIHDGRLGVRIPSRAAGRSADVRPRRRRFRYERDSARVSELGSVGDRFVQLGPAYGFAYRRLVPRPHAARVVPPVKSMAAEFEQEQTEVTEENRNSPLSLFPPVWFRAAASK